MISALASWWPCKNRRNVLGEGGRFLGERAVTTAPFPQFISQPMRIPVRTHFKEVDSQTHPSGENAIEDTVGKTVFNGIPAGHQSMELPDTQVAVAASVDLQDAPVAHEASVDLPETQVPLEDERQAILACAHAMGGCTRAGGYNRLFQISSRASPPHHPTCKMRAKPRGLTNSMR